MSLELLSVIVLSFTLAVVLFAYDRQMRELQRLKKERGTLGDQAREKARELVEGARSKAVEIIGEAKIDAVKWQQVMNQELDKLMSNQLGEYKQQLHNVSDKITEEVQGEAVEFKKALESETAGLEKAIEDRRAEAFARVDKEAEEYRLKRFAQIEEKAADVLQEVGRQVFHRAIDISDQTELIIEALEKAKKDNVI